MPKVKKIKTEAFELMQYLYGFVHDPLIHAMIGFSGHLDEAALTRAVTLSIKAVPLIGCRLNAQPRRPRWEKHGFTGGDIVRVVEADPGDEAQAKRLLASTIDFAREPQLRIFLLRDAERDTLCLIINHMVSDGAGLKEYLYLLSGLYTCCTDPGQPMPALDAGPRGTRQLFAGFSLAEKWKITRAKYDLEAQKRQAEYRLEGDAARPFFVTSEIGQEDLPRLRDAARSRQATMNDMMLAAYARVMSRRIGQSRIVIPCPVVLRKYLLPGRPHGICNLTSNYICDVRVEEGDTFGDTLGQVITQMKRQKESADCLKSVILLEAAFRLLPFSYIKKNFGRLFAVPVLSYTNLGVIDRDRLRFGGLSARDAFLTGAVKYVPYFQYAFSTFDGRLTMSSNLHGTENDRRSIAALLAEIRRELAVG